MTFGKLLFLAAAILLFLAGIGSTVIPNPMIWALFCLALGFLMDGFELSLKRR